MAEVTNPNLTDSELDTILESLLDESIRKLEDNANLYAALNEEQLTGILKFILERDWLRVDCETNVNGHVDLRIEVDFALSTRRRLAEAKCWDGPKYHADGIAQLLGYMTGRESSGYMIGYVQKPNIAEKWKDLQLYLDDKLPADQEAICQCGTSTWTLEARHRHSSGVSIRIVHYGVNLGR
ncbi:MAG: hypothetical protein V4568_09345 [Pseudomonadota bacterium]